VNVGLKHKFKAKNLAKDKNYITSYRVYRTEMLL